MLISISILVVSFLAALDSVQSLRVSPFHAEKTTDYWYQHAIKELDDARSVPFLNKRAKNVILFLGDGMSIGTLTAARILKGQRNNKPGEEGYLHFEKFPHVSLIKTYNIDKQVPDSAGTATAFMCGVKANYGTLGINAALREGNPDCEGIKNSQVHSFLQWAHDAGKSTGIVTTTRITHATPGASYAHISDRDWENDAIMPRETQDASCKDIARQLIEESPGNKFKVILGGGRRNMLPKEESDPRQTEKKGFRADGVNLIDRWLRLKQEEHGSYEKFKYVNDTRGLRDIDFDKVESLMGLFNHDHVSYHEERDTSPDGEPSLQEMATAAIKILQKNKEGFAMLIEGGRIDHAHHENWANLALSETLSFDQTIEAVSKMVNLDETLIVVTADHAHTLTINGYPERGEPISGFSDHNETGNGKPITTLMYGNGPGNPGYGERPTPANTSALRYRQHSAVHVVESLHGGEDVALYSSGPMAHLFHGLHEQSYVAHVIGYACCMGNYNTERHCFTKRDSTTGQGRSSALAISSFTHLAILVNLILAALCLTFHFSNL